MSDLQVSLLVIGGAVIGGVVAFNWFQQWRLRRRLDHDQGREDETARLRTSARNEPTQRVEPQFQSPRAAVEEDRSSPLPAAHCAPATQAAALVDLPDVPGFDELIDYVAAIDAPEPISAAGLAELHSKAAAGGRRFRVAGFNAQSHSWEEAGRLSGGRYAHLRLAVQLVSRKGVVDAATLNAICAAVRSCAASFSAVAHCPDVDSALARARELDSYCADVDVSIGVNVVSAPHATFAGSRIRAVAEGAGLKLESDGLFHYRDQSRQTLFTLDNQEPAPFVPEQMKQLNTSGVTLVLDVPRVADGRAALELMLKTGAQLAADLNGALVDDNRVALGEKAVSAIEQQLTSIHSRMEAQGMRPGGDRALRLFS
jgi:hypothetical protein